MKKTKINPELTPYDWDLVAMIEGLIKSPVRVFKDVKKKKFQLYWDLDPEIEDFQKLHFAIIEAIKGRTGERYLSTHLGKTNITSIEFSIESWPTENRYKIGPVLEEYAFDFISTVKAVQYDRNDSQRLAMFVGGGTEIIEVSGKSSTFSFPNQDGVWMHVNENDYVVLQNDCFRVMNQKEFKKQFKIQL